MKIQDVINLAKKRGPKTVSVACCQDKEVLLAVENARKEVTRNKLQDKVDLRLGSGIEVLKENEVDEIIIAGMGGMLINNLLKANEKVAHTTEKLILQPMQAPEELRMFLYQNRYKRFKRGIFKSSRTCF